MTDDTPILVRLRTACYSLEQAVLVAHEEHSPYAARLSQVLDQLDQLCAEIKTAKIE